MTAVTPYTPEPFTDFADVFARDTYHRALSEVADQLGQAWPLVIGGAAIHTERTILSLDPCRPSRVVGQVAMAGAAELERAFAVAEEAFVSWSRWPAAARARALFRLAAVLRRRKLELCAWETFEAGKNYREADADVAEAIDFVEYYARCLLDLERPLTTTPVPGEENLTTLEPLGVGVVIPPWNFLLAILVGTAVAPVAVGNCVILKPSPFTSVIAGVFMSCVAEAGWPPGVINLLTGADEEIGDRLVDDPRTRFINFTGSVATGLRIHQRAAVVHPGQRHLKRTMLELGGKDALIVDETADLALAAEVVVQSAFGFNGQKCSALSRLIVVDAVHDELVKGVVEATARLSIGPADENFDVTAVASERQYQKVLAYMDLANREATVAIGGSRAEGFAEGYYLAPTVVTGVVATSQLAQEEIFGPLLCVIRASDFAEALAIANDTPYGLTGGVMSRSRERLEQARQTWKVGNLYLNRKITGALVGVQPFGGVKLSGTNSKAGGPEYLRLFMEAKTVTERF
jgi:1-pyrroline-5-carboxylate dehydrogenase